MKLPIPQAMTWKYNAKCSKTPDGQDILVWEHSTLPKPSKAQVAIDVGEYNAWLVIQEAKEAQAKQNIETELLKPAGDALKILKALRILGKI